MGREIDQNSSYTDKLVKLIPVEIVAAYLAIYDLVLTKPEIREVALYTSAVILTLLIPFYLIKIHSIKSILQISITVISFLVWAFSISVMLLNSIGIDSIWGTIILILWTTVIPVIQFKESRGDER